jgi:hypothetical protein
MAKNVINPDAIKSYWNKEYDTVLRDANFIKKSKSQEKSDREEIKQVTKKMNMSLLSEESIDIEEREFYEQEKRDNVKVMIEHFLSQKFDFD